MSAFDPKRTFVEGERPLAEIRHGTRFSSSGLADRLRLPLRAGSQATGPFEQLVGPRSSTVRHRRVLGRVVDCAEKRSVIRAIKMSAISRKQVLPRWHHELR